MKPQVVLAAAALWLFQASFTIAGSCRVIEYAELKDTSTADLVKTYCLYKQFTDIELEFLEKAREIAAGGLNASLKRSMSEHSTSLHECLDTRSKISSALKNRGEPHEPSCVLPD